MKITENRLRKIIRNIIRESIEVRESIKEKIKVLIGEFDEFIDEFYRVSGSDAYYFRNSEEFVSDPDLLAYVYGELSKEFQDLYDEMLDPESFGVNIEEGIFLRRLFFKSLKAGDKTILIGYIDKSSADAIKDTFRRSKSLKNVFKPGKTSKGNIRKKSYDYSSLKSDSDSISKDTKFFAYTRNDIKSSFQSDSLFTNSPRSMQLSNTNAFKPAGIWFGKEDEWKRFCEENNFNVDGKYRYKFLVELDLNRICVLDSDETRQAFESVYLEGSGIMAKINWANVTDDYDGIVITESAILPVGWTSTWDITSGCVWRASGITKIDNTIFDLDI